MNLPTYIYLQEDILLVLEIGILMFNRCNYFYAAY